MFIYLILLFLILIIILLLGCVILVFNFDDFMKHHVFDMAVSTGTYAFSRGLDKTQLGNIIEIFESEADSAAAAKLTIAFIARQIGRGEIYEDVGNRIVSDLTKILKSFKGSELRAAVRKYLYLLKWFYESKVRSRVNNFEEYVNKLSR